VFAFGIGLFTIASVACGASPNVGFLIVARPSNPPIDGRKHPYRSPYTLLRIPRVHELSRWVLRFGEAQGSEVGWPFGSLKVETYSGANDEIRLYNCPFRTLFTEYRDVVRGMNLSIMQGVKERRHGCHTGNL
jgi:hypothetical protein